MCDFRKITFKWATDICMHSLVLHRNFMSLSVDFDNDRPVRGRENGEIV